MKTTTIPDVNKHVVKIPIPQGITVLITPVEKPLGHYQRPILSLVLPKKESKAELISLQSRRKT